MLILMTWERVAMNSASQQEMQEPELDVVSLEFSRLFNKKNTRAVGVHVGIAARRQGNSDIVEDHTF